METLLIIVTLFIFCFVFVLFYFWKKVLDICLITFVPENKKIEAEIVENYEEVCLPYSPYKDLLIYFWENSPRIKNFLSRQNSLYITVKSIDGSIDSLKISKKIFEKIEKSRLVRNGYHEILYRKSLWSTQKYAIAIE